MKIRSIEAFKIPALSIRTGLTEGGARRAPWQTDAEVANPMSRYPRYKALRESWRGKFDAVGVLVTADDGSWGFGTTILRARHDSLINDHLGPLLVDENPMATERLWDMMMRIASPYSPAGLASYAISGIDLALWDLKGRVLKMPVYELAGGPARESQFCYATGNDTDWHMELGFKATKLACPYGTADGLDALRRNEELVGEDPRADRARGRADARLLDGVRRRVRGPAGRAAAALPAQVDRGLPDPRGPGLAQGAARAAAVADADRRASTGTRPMRSSRRRATGSSTSSSPTSTGSAASPPAAGSPTSPRRPGSR